MNSNLFDMLILGNLGNEPPWADDRAISSMQRGRVSRPHSTASDRSTCGTSNGWQMRWSGWKLSTSS